MNGGDERPALDHGRWKGRMGNFPAPQLGLTMPPWEAVNGGFLKAVLSEYLHTTMFLFVVIGSICFGCHSASVGVLPPGQVLTGDAVNQPLGNPVTCRLTDTRILSIATVFGFAIAVVVYSSATFSGGHINPAVTVGLLVARKVTLMRAVAYIVAQLFGAVTGTAFVYAIDYAGWDAAGGGANSLQPFISDAAGWAMEMLLTAMLVFVVLAATDTNREAIGAHLPILAPFAIGLAVFVAHLVAIPIDGCSINPARSFAPALLTNTWDKQWIFWIGPLSGGIVAAVAYEVFFRPSRGSIAPPKEEHGHGAPMARLPPYAGLQGVDYERLQRLHSGGDKGGSVKDPEDQDVAVPAGRPYAGNADAGPPRLPHEPTGSRVHAPAAAAGKTAGS